MDLRERIAAAVEIAEESHPLIAERFGVSIATVERISRRLREGSGLQPRKSTGRPPALGDEHYEHIRRELEKDPFMSSYDLARRFKRFFPSNPVHRSTILRAMHDLGYSFKKKDSVRSSA